jgi:hypothetical protein
MAGNVHIPEEDNNVSVHLALGIHAAKKTDCVMCRRVGSDPNVVKEMHVIGIGMGGNRGRRKSSAKQGRGYSCSPVGVEENTAAKWLFPQEKATPKGLGDAICTGEQLKHSLQIHVRLFHNYAD